MRRDEFKGAVAAEFNVKRRTQSCGPSQHFERTDQVQLVDAVERQNRNEMRHEY